MTGPGWIDVPSDAMKMKTILMTVAIAAIAVIVAAAAFVALGGDDDDDGKKVATGYTRM